MGPAEADREGLEASFSPATRGVAAPDQVRTKRFPAGGRYRGWAPPQRWRQHLLRSRSRPSIVPVARSILLKPPYRKVIELFGAPASPQSRPRLFAGVGSQNVPVQ